MKIGIMGTRGIPNRYGGFEQFAEQLSLGLVQRGHEVFVYNSSLHDYKENNWNGVHIIHCRDKEDSLGTAGQFIYDRNCIRDAHTRNFDVLLHLGYTSDSVWHKRWPKDCLNVVNMDGLEWKRAKYNWITRQFLMRAESWAAKNADVLIADNPAIKTYLESKYSTKVVYIPYPVKKYDPNHNLNPQTRNHKLQTALRLQPFQYFLAVARMEPENNLEMIIEGYLEWEKIHLNAEGAEGSRSLDYPLVIVGNAGNMYGRWLVKKYKDDNIKFVGAVYEKEVLNDLRYHSAIFFHGHSVGGTNPSLLEAMGCGCRIAAHDNEFNRYVLGDKGEYFSNSKGVLEILKTLTQVPRPVAYDPEEYSLERIVDFYEKIFIRK
jgi:glycosyltransferase involved in cell wall biosynthesis